VTVDVAAFLARRFLSGRRGGLLGTVSGLALFGVALGAAALTVAMGLMSGYRGELQEKLAGTNAEILVVQEPGLPDADVRAPLSAVPGVAAVSRTAFASGLLLSPSGGGVDAVVKGIELPNGLLTTRLLGGIPGLSRAFAQAGEGVPALLGAGLATRLGAGTGAHLVLETASASLARGLAAPRRAVLRVVAIAETGFSEVDDGWVVLPLAAFDRVAPPDARQGIWELRLEHPSRTDEVAAAVSARLGPGASVIDWKVFNKDLFQALLLQQTLLFIGLALIVAVAAGTIVSTLVVLLAEKTRDVGVLLSIGGGPRLVGRTFRRAGLLLGGSGLVAGTLFGVLVCQLLTRFRLVRFPPEIAKVYYLSWMPFRPSPAAVGAILVVGTLLVLLASLLPARRAARLSPADALRYE
jgi:lipoprotein-releasing system permease protein